MAKLRYNKSKTYLLPLLSELISFDKKYFSFLKNTYLKDDLNMYKNCFYILHDFSFKNPEFTAYEHKLINNPYFVDLIDVTKDQVLYIFKFPEEYLTEYDKFINSKYSEFGLDAKELILNYYNDIYNGNINAVNFLLKVKQILFKDEKLRFKLEQELSSPGHIITIDKDAELSDPVDIESETINISEYINNKNKIMNNKMELD